LEGEGDTFLDEYATPGTDKHHAMIDRIRQRLALTTLRYQELGDLVNAIGLPKEKVCTYCWDGVEVS
jgi:amidophosphoribosyltransferase